MKHALLNLYIDDFNKIKINGLHLFILYYL